MPRLRALVACLARLIAVSPLSAEEEAGNSDTATSSSMLTAGTMNPFSINAKLPMPALGNMHECERAIKQSSRPPHGKEKLCDALMHMVSTCFLLRVGLDLI